MIHPDTELQLVNEVIGYGVFATKRIPRGTITWVRDRFDQCFTPGEISAMPPHYQSILSKYSFTDRGGNAILCWDLARFMNHSCEANCLSPGYDFEVAIRDIEEGAELTDDYGTLNLDSSFVCACALPTCRREIMPEDILRYSALWDDQLRRAFPLIARVHQPLWPFVNEKEAIQCAAGAVEQMRSSADNHFAGPKRTWHPTV